MESEKTPGYSVINGPVFHGDVTFEAPVTFQMDKEVQKPVDESVKAAHDEVDVQVETTDMENYTKHLGDPSIYQIRKLKGNVLIVNNGFEGTDNERRGSSLDIWRMEDLWRQLGCETTITKDLSCDEMKSKVEDFLNFKIVPDFCVIILMSHGKSGDLIVGNDKSEVKVKEILEYIKTCKSVIGKPKACFIQMCRGEKGEKVDFIDGAPFDTHESTWFNKILKSVLPNGADINSSRDMIEDHGSRTKISKPGDDMMIAFSTQPDYVSFRSETGSWFIKAIAKIFAKDAKYMHLVELMKSVQVEVKKNVSNMVREPRYDRCTATIEVHDTMENKKLYFFPGCPIEID